MTQSTPELLPTQADEKLAIAISLAFNVPLAERANLAKYLARHRIEHSTPVRNAVLEEALREAKTANEAIGLNRDGQGSGRVKVATAMHRIERLLSEALTATPEPTDPAGVSEMADDLSLRDRLMIEIAYCRHAELPVSEEVTRLLAILSTRTPDPVLEVVKERHLKEWAEDAVRQAFIEGAQWQKDGRPGRFADAVQKSLAPQLQALAALQTINERGEA